MKLLHTLRLFLFGPSREYLEAEPAPPLQILSSEQRETLKRQIH